MTFYSHRVSNTYIYFIKSKTLIPTSFWAHLTILSAQMNRLCDPAENDMQCERFNWLESLQGLPTM